MPSICQEIDISDTETVIYNKIQDIYSKKAGEINNNVRNLVYEYVTLPYLKELVSFMSQNPYEVTCQGKNSYANKVKDYLLRHLLAHLLTTTFSHTRPILRMKPIPLSTVIMPHYSSQSRIFIPFITSNSLHFDISTPFLRRSTTDATKPCSIGY